MTAYSDFVKSYMNKNKVLWNCAVCEIKKKNLYKKKSDSKKKPEPKKPEPKKPEPKKPEPKKPEPKKPEPKPEPKKAKPEPEPEPDTYKEIVMDWTDSTTPILFFQSKESKNITQKIEQLSSKDNHIIPMQLFRLNKDLLNDLVSYRVNLKMKPKEIIKEVTEGMANYINYISGYEYDMENAIDNFDYKSLNARNKKYIGIVK